MRGIYDVQDFGAKGDGITNDLAALQAASDAVVAAGGGTVWLGPGSYNIGNGTWKIGQTPTQHHVNIEGINLNTSTIACDTSAGNAAIYLNLEKYVTLKGFSVVNQGARGGYGIQFGGDLGTGMQTNGNNLQHILFQNFAYGAYMSGGIGTSSEIVFNHCIWQGNNYGFYSANFNALNFLFLMPELYNNGAGMYISTGNMTVIGGASNANGNDFYIAGGNDGTVKIQSFRAEAPLGTWLVALANNYLSVEDCIIHPRASGVEVINILAGINIKNTILNGYITAHVFQNSSITLDGISVNTPGTDWSLTNQYSSAYPPYGPGFRMTNNQGQVANSRACVRNVFEQSTKQMYPDVNCTFGIRPYDNMRVALCVQ